MEAKAAQVEQVRSLAESCPSTPLSLPYCGLGTKEFEVFGWPFEKSLPNYDTAGIAALTDPNFLGAGRGCIC